MGRSLMADGWRDWGTSMYLGDSGGMEARLRVVVDRCWGLGVERHLRALAHRQAGWGECIRGGIVGFGSTCNLVVPRGSSAAKQLRRCQDMKSWRARSLPTRNSRLPLLGTNPILRNSHATPFAGSRLGKYGYR